LHGFSCQICGVALGHCNSNSNRLEQPPKVAAAVVAAVGDQLALATRPRNAPPAFVFKPEAKAAKSVSKTQCKFEFKRLHLLRF